MRELSCKSKTLLNTDQGPIVEIAFAGEYPSGEVGDHAFVMMDYVTSVVSKENPAAVLFNFTEYEYRGGDAIGQIIIPLGDPVRKVFRPACVVALGQTAKSMQWFFEPNVMWGMEGWKLFDKVEDGLAFLQNRLEGMRDSDNS